MLSFPLKINTKERCWRRFEIRKSVTGTDKKKKRTNWKSSVKIQHHIPKDWCSITHKADVVLGPELFDSSTSLSLYEFVTLSAYN